MDENPSEDEIQEYDLLEEDTARPMSPIQFFGPHGAPVADKDFRPTTFIFNENDKPDEDGQGNMRKSQDRPPTQPKHPTEKRKPQPYEMTGRHGIENSDQQELDLKPSSEERTDQEESKKAPGIAGSTQGNQPPEE